MAQGIPKYILIADSILHQIKDGTYVIGQKLPTETKVMQAYGVSRHTVRQALQKLKSLDLIASHQGQGSIVIANGTAPKYVEQIDTIEDLIANSSDSHRVFIDSNVKKTGPALSQKLQCEPERLVVHLSLQRYQDVDKKRPFAIVSIWMDALFQSAVPRIAIGQEVIANVISDEFGLTVGYVEQSITTEKLSQENAVTMGLTKNDPVLVVERSYAENINAAPYLIARSVCNPSITQIVSKFTSVK
jgi:GntR family transcriptional regulator